MNTVIIVHNNGIVNQFQVVEDVENPDNDNLIQVLWNGKLQGMIYDLNTAPTPLGGDIKDYRAVYLNGVMIVKNGKVHPRKRLLGVF